MDIRCRHCGEPWDNESLHDEARSRGNGWDYERMQKRFRHLGCEAFEHGAHNPQTLPSEGMTADERDHHRARNEMVGMITDLLGDDIDGLASELEDAERLGYLT